MTDSTKEKDRIQRLRGLSLIALAVFGLGGFLAFGLFRTGMEQLMWSVMAAQAVVGAASALGFGIAHWLSRGVHADV